MITWACHCGAKGRSATEADAARDWLVHANTHGCAKVRHQELADAMAGAA